MTADAQVPTPISVTYFYICGSLQGIILNYNDGEQAPYSADEVNGNPPLAKALESLPHKTVYLSALEPCSCHT